MKQIIQIDDHDLCIRTFLKEIDHIGLLPEKRAVFHVGAHVGEEVPAYKEFGFSPIFLAEPNPEILPTLFKNFDADPDIHILPVAIGAFDGEMDFFIHRTAKGGMESSGLLDLDKLGEIVPTFDSSSRHRVKLTTIDKLDEQHVFSSKVGLLVLDIQGAEVMALTGATKFLKNVIAVICEVNLIKNYEGCALEEEVDQIFSQAGFIKHLAIYHELYDDSGRFPAWGECLWLNRRHVKAGA